MPSAKISIAFKAKLLHFLPTQKILLLDIESRTPSKMKSGKILSIYDFFQHNFLCPIVDTVHGSNPGHLVCCFQFLSHALRYLHLLNNQGQTLLCLLVQIGKVSPELSFQNQIVKSHRAMLFQILQVHPPIFSDRAFLIGKLQIRNVVISCQHIIHSIDILFAFHKLDLDFKIFVTSRLTGVVVV